MRGMGHTRPRRDVLGGDLGEVGVAPAHERHDSVVADVAIVPTRGGRGGGGGRGGAVVGVAVVSDAVASVAVAVDPVVAAVATAVVVVAWWLRGKQAVQHCMRWKTVRYPPDLPPLPMFLLWSW